MRVYDLLVTCLQNLMRRRVRTALTMLGVVIGCCAIIVTVSLGVGSTESINKMLSEMGDLTMIQVYSGGGGGMVMIGGGGSSSSGGKLDDEAVKNIQAIPNVVVATPKLRAQNISISLYAGNGKRYRATYAEIVGIDPDAIEKIGYKIIEGKSLSKRPFSVLVGENFAYSFEDTLRPQGYNMVSPYPNETGEITKAYFNPMVTPVQMEIQGSQANSEVMTQKLEIAGRMKEEYDRGYETSQGILMNIKDLQALMKKQHVANTNQYQDVLVKVNDIQNVKEVEQAITAMGLGTSSMESIREPMEKEVQQKQLLLGGVGAISLFVAAIGIANTMIMSISERTREIGVMKALGCYVRNIRCMFLMESGFIGLLGGIGGIIISFIISVIMNLVSSSTPVTSIQTLWEILVTPGSRLSVIPWWLYLSALLFAILVGLISGYYPANKAVKIPALEAIKHE